MATRQHLTRTLAGAGAALLALASVSGCAHADRDHHPDKRDFALSGKQLTVVAQDATVELQPADVDKVEVTRWFHGWAVLGTTPRAHWSMKGHTLTLRIDCGAAMAHSCADRHRVLVPRGVAVTVHGDNGRVSASGFDTALHVGVSNGAVSVHDVSGALTMTSGNGALNGSGLHSGKVRARTSNGSIHLEFADAPDDVGVHTSNGSVHVDLPKARYQVEHHTHNGAVNVSVPQGGTNHKINIASSNGSISVDLAH